jgi:hypothetical protein
MTAKRRKLNSRFDGQTLEIGYTIDDAKKVMGKDDKGKDRIDQPDSNWAKDRGAMLRARLITKAIRIIAPELIAGVYTPEELEDSGAVSTVVPAKDRASRNAENWKQIPQLELWKAHKPQLQLCSQSKSR